MRINIIGSFISFFCIHNVYTTFGPNHIFYKKGNLTHHGAPTRLIPTHRTVVKTHLQLTVVVHVVSHFVGESGTGKELVANALHQRSDRQDGPFVAVNCGAIPGEILESELFGHEKGAFTGAHFRRKGKLEMADGGTLFLDEIGELNGELQAKLLRVLQEGEYTPVGSSKTRRTDVRVIAATNRDLSMAVQEGKFRADLYYRLNVFPIEIPPLNRRGDDIRLLAEHFVNQFSTLMGKEILPFDVESIECLKGYDWPGNVRELRNAMERAVALAKGRRVELEDLPEEVRQAQFILVSHAHYDHVLDVPALAPGPLPGAGLRPAAPPARGGTGAGQR